MYEHHSAPVLPKLQFVWRVTRHIGVAVLLLAVSLGIGVAGFVWLDGRSPLDGLLNAAMLLGGMGPVGEFSTPEGKLFGAAYALFSGLVFIVCAALAVTPTLHRMLHRLHLGEND